MGCLCAFLSCWWFLFLMKPHDAGILKEASSLMIAINCKSPASVDSQSHVILSSSFWSWKCYWMFPLCDLPISPNYFKYVIIATIIITIDGDTFCWTQRKGKCVLYCYLGCLGLGSMIHCVLRLLHHDQLYFDFGQNNNGPLWKKLNQ